MEKGIKIKSDLVLLLFKHEFATPCAAFISYPSYLKLVSQCNVVHSSIAAVTGSRRSRRVTVNLSQKETDYYTTRQTCYEEQWTVKEYPQ